MAKHLVLVGGGHAHMTVMLELAQYTQRGHRVTVVNSDPYHYYSGMGPGMLSGIYRPEEIRFHVKKMVEDRGASFVEGRVVHVDTERRRLGLESSQSIDYDVVSFNTGSGIDRKAISGITDEMIPVKPIINLLKAREELVNRLASHRPRIVVVGGGAAGLEIAGNLDRLVRDAGGEAQITLVAGRRFLSPFPDRVRRLALGSFNGRGITVIESARVSRFESPEAVLEDDRRIPYDMVFLATGVKPSSLFKDSGLPTGNDGALLVNHRLQSVAYPDIFGGGDCISLEDGPLDKVGVYAVRQNPILYRNLLSALEGGVMERFEPQANYLLIFNLGNGRGIFCRRGLVLDGRWPFFLKDHIDRKFMNTFQVSGECSR
ncbi:MAG: FAD-dependent oxidoreductase [bacterium]|nr:FAD-dependent oxidoreductase [bacterium]